MRQDAGGPHEEGESSSQGRDAAEASGLCDVNIRPASEQTCDGRAHLEVSGLTTKLIEVQPAEVPADIARLM